MRSLNRIHYFHSLNQKTFILKHSSIKVLLLASMLIVTSCNTAKKAAEAEAAKKETEKSKEKELIMGKGRDKPKREKKKPKKEKKKGK